MAGRIVLNTISYHGKGAIAEIPGVLKSRGYQKAFVCSDPDLVRFGVTRFRALFQGNRSRSEVVATFIAVLELCKAKRIRLAGTDTDCTVSSTGEGETEMEFSTDAY